MGSTQIGVSKRLQDASKCSPRVLFLPLASVLPVLLPEESDLHLVTSSARRIPQASPLTWQSRAHMVCVVLSVMSRTIDALSTYHIEIAEPELV